MEHTGNHYILKNDDWNSVISAGQSVKIGFEAKPGNHVGKPTNYILTKSTSDTDGGQENEEIDLSKIDLKNDSDGDGLKDGIEDIIGTDKLKKDSDNDGINDYDEIYTTQTDPLKNDSDGNGITDDKDDKDKDGLNNLKELEIGTDPLYKDTDNDTLDDKNEIDNYKTDPLNNDSDGDDVDYYSNKVSGLLGVPVEIETTSIFENAEIIFHYTNLPANMKEENLGVLWYNEEEGIYEEQDSTVDTIKKTVTAKVNHFSTYLVVDKDKWLSIWKQPVKYSNAELAVPSSDICILIDNSLSMNKKKLEEIKAVAIEFVSTLKEEDKIAVVSFDAYNGKQVAALNKNKENAINAIKKIQIATSNPRSAETTTKGLEMAVKELKTEQSKNGRYILLFYDDDMKYNEAIIKTAKESNIHLFAVNIQKMILNLGGYYYNADNQKSMYLSAENTNNILKTGIDMKDTDGDGLFDIYEKKGIRVSNGQLVKTDYKNKDSDQDGLNDFKELNASRIKTANSKIVRFE